MLASYRKILSLRLVRGIRVRRIRDCNSMGAYHRRRTNQSNPIPKLCKVVIFVHEV